MKQIKTLSILTFLLISHLSIAQFSFNPSFTAGCAPLGIDFINTSSSGVHFDWDYGDGNSVTDVTDGSHLYTTDGNYNVTMYAYDATYAFLGQTNMTIEVIAAPSDISMSSTTVCPNDEVGMWVWVPGATGYSWDFGDGTTASGSDYVNHTYTTPGVYSVQVVISNPYCADFTVNSTITVTLAAPYFGGNPWMGLSPLSACPNEQIQGWTSNEYSPINWDFGDGNSDTGDNVYFSYAAIGSYNVQMTVTNGCGTDTTLTDVIVVSSTTPVLNADVNAPDTICPGEQFYVGGYADNGLTYEWSMGDGTSNFFDQDFYYSYATPAIYTVNCQITNACGNTDLVNKTIVVTPNATVQNPQLNINQTLVCPGDPVDFWSNSDYTYYIDFGDGNGTNSYANHVYTNPGVYPITCTIQNVCGNITVLYDTVTVQNNLPVGNVNAYINSNPICPNDEVEFYSDYGYSNYVWVFGDGTGANGEQVDHIYNVAGNYNVSVVVTNGCGSQAVGNVVASIQNNLPIGNNISFEMSSDTTCLGNSIFFELNGNDGYDYLWNLGDGTTSTNPSLAHTYSTLGIFPIELTIMNGCGSDTTLVDTVVVSNSYSPTIADFQSIIPDEGCVGDELSFILLPAGAGDIIWDFGDGNTTNQVEQVFVQGITHVDVASHTYSTAGNYWVKYTITNACGNSVTDSLEVTIGTLGDQIDLDAFFFWDQTVTACQGQPVEFMALGGATYVWDFGDGSGNLVTYSSLSPVYHTYDDAGTYTVSLNTYNSCGNSDDSDNNIIVPESKIDVTTNTVVEPNCGTNNGMAIVSALGGTPPYTYSWTNGDNGVIADSLASGIYVITVTDNNDCSTEGIATVSDEEGVTILIDNVVDVNCYGNDNGSISVSILGGQAPYTILWSNGDQTEDVFGLQAGPYEIFVTDANGCFAVESIQVSQPSKSNISIITSAASCGLNDGSAMASVNDGTGPFNYIWSNATGPVASTGGLAPGTYELLVIDGNTCLLQQDFVVNEVGGPIIITDSTSLGTCNGTLSSIYLSTIGGTSPFVYSWSNGSSNEDLTGVVPGQYTVEIESAGGCSSFAQFEVVESQPEQTTICMVDVDSLTGTNLVVWSPITAAGIASYNIYKESSEAGLYYLIGNSSADSISQYFDYLSDPFIRSWRYKVAAVDDCGNEAELSLEHKTIHLTSNQGISGEINLIWDHYQGFSYPTYYINRYHPTTGWQVLDSVASNLFSYTDANPPGDSSLVYMITIETPGTCTAYKATDYNSSRSNKEGINQPDDGSSGGAGIDETVFELEIYPNPSNGLIQINYTSNLDAVKLYDLAGKLVFEDRSVGTNKLTVDLSSFERGVYTIQITSAGKIINGKVIRN